MVVIGITDHSFAQPVILLSATVGANPRYFEEKLNATRSTLVQIWKKRSALLSPTYPGTDILGALMLAGQIFNEQPSSGKKMLIIYSDMRQNTSELDLETATPLPNIPQIEKKARCLPRPKRG